MFNIGAIGSLGGAGRLSAPSTIMPPPAFVPQADGISADIYMDFVNGNYWNATPASFTRASVAWGDNAAGVWSQFAVNKPVITNKGLLLNSAVTNLALWCRDLTQAAWVKTNMTAALNQVGIDGAANSATLLTATAANATVLQSITNASSTTVTSFFLQRVTGTGTVNITTNGGTTWTAVTLTAALTRFFVNVAAVVNPQIGIQITTSGDAIVADFAQCEAIAAVTTAKPQSPVLTTTASATRALDSALIPGLTVGSGITLLAVGTPISSQTGTPQFLGINDGTVSNRIFLARASTVGRCTVQIAGVATNLNSVATWGDVPAKIAAAAASGAVALCFNAATPVAGTPTGFPPGMNQLSIGGPTTGVAGYFYITSIAAWLNHQATNAALQALTAASAATSISLSTTSIMFPTTADAGSFVANIIVAAPTGTGSYVGTLALGGTDGGKFLLTNGGVYPCALIVGNASIGAGTYSISLTSTP